MSVHLPYMAHPEDRIHEDALRCSDIVSISARGPGNRDQPLIRGDNRPKNNTPR